MNIDDIRLVADVQTRNYHGYIESHNTVYLLQVKAEGKWWTMPVVELKDLPPDEKKEVDDYCRRVLSEARKSAAR